VSRIDEKATSGYNYHNDVFPALLVWLVMAQALAMGLGAHGYGFGWRKRNPKHLGADLSGTGGGGDRGGWFDE
jgi:hypothetical protein